MLRRLYLAFALAVVASLSPGIAAAQWSEGTTTNNVKVLADTVWDYEFTTATDSDTFDTTGCNLTAQFDQSTGDTSTVAVIEFRACPTASTAWQQCPLIRTGPDQLKDGVATAIGALPAANPYALVHVATAPTGGDTARLRLTCRKDTTTTSISAGSVADDAVTDPSMGADDFGDWSCLGSAESCTLDAGVVQPADIDVDAAFVFNESGADADTRIEGDTNANLFFVDASTDRVGIGTATPAYTLNVNGNVGANNFFATGSTGLNVTDTSAGVLFEEGSNDVSLKAATQNAASVVSIPSAHSADTATTFVLNVGTAGTNISLDAGVDGDDEFVLTETAITSTAATLSLGAGAATTISVNAGATDPEIDFASSSISFDPDDDGSAECTIDADGMTCTQYESDNAEAATGGNAVGVLANDTTNATIGCSGQASNSLTFNDADQTAADRFDVCIGTTRVSTVGWPSFETNFGWSTVDPDASFDGRCIYKDSFASTTPLFASGLETTCFSSTSIPSHVAMKPTGKNALIQSFMCYLDRSDSEENGDVLAFELIEDTVAGASPTILATITLTAATTFTDDVFSVSSSTPIVVTAAEAGVAVRVQWTDADAGGEVTRLDGYCRVLGIVEP